MGDYLRERLFLIDDPFKVGAPERPKVWASSEKTKEDFGKIIGNILVSESSVLSVIWGTLGTGKTYAANYFIHKGISELIAELRQKKVLKKGYQVFSFPRVVTAVGGRRDVQFLDKIMETVGLGLRKNPEANEIFTKAFEEKDDYTMSAAKSLSLSFEIQKMLEDNVTPDDFFRSVSEQHLPGETGIDLTRLPYILDVFTFTVKILTHRDYGFDRVFLWIDEVEKFAEMPLVERMMNNQFFRECVDLIQEKLAIFLNITTARAGSEDMTAYLSDAIMNRVAYYYHIAVLPEESMAKQYVRNLLGFFRVKKAKVDPFYPFTEECIENILRIGKENFEPLTPRAINIEFEKALASLRREQPDVTPENPIDFKQLGQILTP